MSKITTSYLGIILTGVGISGYTNTWWSGCLFSGIVLMFISFVMVLGDVDL